MHDNHHIRVCGHSLNWHKPIKPYTLVKMTFIAVLAAALIATPSLAADTAEYRFVYLTPQEQASLATAHPAPKYIPEKSVTGQAAKQDQRTAGTPSLSPAMALAMALGLRNATGPMERVQKTVSPSTKDMRQLTGLNGRDALARPSVKNAHALSKKENYSRVALE